MATTRARALISPAPGAGVGDLTAIPPSLPNDEDDESPPVNDENATYDAITIVDVDTDEKYIKYASSLFDRSSLEIIEISVWTVAFAWSEADEDKWGRVPKEEDLLSAIRLKLMSAKDMERVGIRIHSTLAKMHGVLTSKFLELVDKAGDLGQRLNTEVSKKVGSISVEEETADRTGYSPKDPTAAQIGDLVTNPATFVFFGGAKATGKDSASHWRTKIARVHPPGDCYKW